MNGLGEVRGVVGCIQSENKALNRGVKTSYALLQRSVQTVENYDVDRYIFQSVSFNFHSG